MKKVIDYIKSHKADLIALGVISIIFLSLIISNAIKDKKIKYLQTERSLLNEELITWKNSDSTQTARLYTVTADNYRQFQKIKSQDSTITFLQEEVKRVKKQIKEPGSSVTTVDNNTHVSGSTNTNVVQPAAPTDSASKPSPIYETKPPITDDWISLYIKATSTKIYYDLTVRNKYSVVIGQENGKNYAEVKNFNPHTETMAIRTYQVTIPKQKRLGVAVQIGYGLGAGGLTPYIGGGLSYNLFFIK